MWLAKPLHSLSAHERAAWLAIGDEKRAQEQDFPLSQTLAWGEAIQSMGGQAYLIFNPEERVGGLVHSVPSQAGRIQLECVNGPLLSWDDSEAVVARQSATFVMAATKLNRACSSVLLAPRWPLGELQRRLVRVPIEAQEISRASTLQVEVKATAIEQCSVFSSRLRRTLKVGERSGIRCSWKAVDAESLLEFSSGMKSFGKSKGFFVPELAWFESLVFSKSGNQREALRFYLAEARSDGEASALSRLLVLFWGDTAYYLFGYEERSEQTRSAISPSAAAQCLVLEKCAAAQIKVYDLNGYTDPLDDAHPYASVSRFKAQFGGTVIDFASPVFRIET